MHALCSCAGITWCIQEVYSASQQDPTAKKMQKNGSSDHKIDYITGKIKRH